MYYIRIDTYWQGAPDRFVGPFASTQDANAAIERAQGVAVSAVVVAGQTPRDIKSSIRVLGVLTEQEAKNAGMTRANRLGRRVPFDTTELAAEEAAYLYP